MGDPSWTPHPRIGHQWPLCCLWTLRSTRAGRHCRARPACGALTVGAPPPCWSLGCGSSPSPSGSVTCGCGRDPGTPAHLLEASPTCSCSTWGSPVRGGRPRPSTGLPTLDTLLSSRLQPGSLSPVFSASHRTLPPAAWPPPAQSTGSTAFPLALTQATPAPAQAFQHPQGLASSPWPHGNHRGAARKAQTLLTRGSAS